MFSVRRGISGVAGVALSSPMIMYSVAAHSQGEAFLDKCQAGNFDGALGMLKRMENAYGPENARALANYTRDHKRWPCLWQFVVLGAKEEQLGTLWHTYHANNAMKGLWIRGTYTWNNPRSPYQIEYDANDRDGRGRHHQPRARLNYELVNESRVPVPTPGPTPPNPNRDPVVSDRDANLFLNNCTSNPSEAIRMLQNAGRGEYSMALANTTAGNTRWPCVWQFAIRGRGDWNTGSHTVALLRALVEDYGATRQTNITLRARPTNPNFKRTWAKIIAEAEGTNSRRMARWIRDNADA